MTPEQLILDQALSLDEKIAKSKELIKEFYEKNKGKVHVANNGVTFKEATMKTFGLCEGEF